MAFNRRSDSPRTFACVIAFLTALACQTTVAQNADFNVTVNTGPAPLNLATVYPGEATSLRITLSNNSISSSIDNAAFGNSLPNGLVNGLLVGGASAITGLGCDGGTLTTTVGQPTISLSGLNILARTPGVAGSGECYLDIPVYAYSTDGASTSLAYAINAGDVSSDQGVNATGGPQAITVRAAQRPTWSKSMVGGITMILGGPSKILRITLNNPDQNVDLSGISFVDVFPTRGGRAIIEPTGVAASGSCVDTGTGTVDLTRGDTARVAVSGVNLAAGTSCTIDVPVQAWQTDGAYEQTRTNSILAADFSSDQGLRPSANANRSVRARSPLAISKSFTPDIVASGEPNSFRITLSNNGLTPLAVSNFTDDPIAAAPHQDKLNIANVGDISNSCAGGSAQLESGGQGFSVSGFSIPANGFCRLDVTYTGTTPGFDTPTTYTNNIPAGAVQTPVPGVVSQARSATVLVADRLRVLKTASPADASPGDPVRYEVTIQNFSSSPISDVSVADDLQNGSTLLLSGPFAPTLSPAVECGSLGLNGASEGDSSVTFGIPTLPERTGSNTPGTCTIAFSVMLDPASTNTTDNQIGVGDLCYGSGTPVCNNVASSNVDTDPLDSMTVEKRFDGQNSVAKSEGTPTRLQLTVSNNSVNSLTSLTLSDTLPSAGPFQQLRVANPPNVSNDCGGSVTAVAESTSVSLNGGTVPAYDGSNAGTCTVEVDVVGPAGVYPNTVDASAVRHNANGTTTALIDDDDATLTYTDALQVSKDFIPDSTGENGRATVSIRLQSLDPGRPITEIEFTDNLPAGMLVADPGNAYVTCDGPTDLSADTGSTVVSLSGAALAPLATCEVRFDVLTSGTSNWVNTIPAGGVTAAGGITNRTPVSATLLYQAPEFPLISKAITPGSIVPGESALLTINLTNAALDLTNLQVADYFTQDGLSTGLPNGMSIAPAPEASTNCPSGVVAATPGGASVALSGVSLAANQACEVRVRVTSTTVGTLTNTIPMNSIVTDQGATNSTSFAQSTLSTTSEIGVSKTFTPAVVSPSEPATLRITIFNARVEALTGMDLLDQFPAGLVVAPTPNAFSDCGGSVVIAFPDPASVRMTGARIGAAQGDEAASCYLETDVVAANEGTYLNAIPADSLTANGTAIPHPETTARLEVRQRLIVNKAFDDLTLDANDPVGFTTGVAARLPGVEAPVTIRIENPNATELTEVNFIDSLPDGLVLAGTPDLATTCTDGVVAGVPAGREIRLTGATLAATGDSGAICTVTARVVSNIPGIYTNEIAIGDVGSFEGIDNNPGTQAQIVITEPPELSKEFAPPVVAPDVASTLSIVIHNDNDLEMTLSADLVDNLPSAPAQMVVATPANIGTSCPGGNGIVTAVPDGSSVTVASGSEVPAGGCVVTVDVTAPLAGDYLNHIPVGALVSNFGTSLAPATAPLKVSTLGYISGKVFLDNQPVPDGNYLPGDSTPIPGNLLELRDGIDCSGALLASTTTDDQGNYLFSDLLAGPYSVCQPTQPADTLNSVTQPGVIAPYMGSTGTVGTASNPLGGVPTSQIVEIVLNNNGNADEVSGSPENDFSEVLPVSIAGNVYYDVNHDGLFDSDETGIGGVTVTLTGPVILVTVTNPDGSYSFTNLPPGEYTVTETHPTDWTDGEDTAGNVAGVTRGDDGADDVISTINLEPGDAGVEYNFGETLSGVSLAIDASASCVQDVPYIHYSLLNLGGAPGATVELFTEDGRLVRRLENQASSGTLLWPGAVLDGDNNGVGWPGWELQDSGWIQVPDDRIPQLTLRVSINPSVEAVIDYPPATAACLTQPAGTFGPRSIPVAPQGLLWLMGMLVLLIAGRGLQQRSRGRQSPL